MSEANPLWGAPRIHGELLKLGIDISRASVAKYMRGRSRPRVLAHFLDESPRADHAADFFVVPPAAGRLLFVLVMLLHDVSGVRGSPPVAGRPGLLNRVSSERP